MRMACKECNLILYLVNLQRTSLKRILKQSNYKKNKASVEYLGCDIEYFKAYIESKFIYGMSWDNIHLDHIKPVSVFNLNDPEEFLNCCSYFNFQPLLAKDNLNKSNKWNKDDEIFWESNIKNKEYIQIYMPK